MVVPLSEIAGFHKRGILPLVRFHPLYSIRSLLKSGGEMRLNQNQWTEKLYWKSGYCGFESFSCVCFLS